MIYKYTIKYVAWKTTAVDVISVRQEKQTLFTTMSYLYPVRKTTLNINAQKRCIQLIEICEIDLRVDSLVFGLFYSRNAIKFIVRLRLEF